MSFWLLLVIKMRLLRRSLLRRGGGQLVLIGLSLLAMLGLAWLMLGRAAGAAAAQGASGVVMVLGVSHFGWLFSAFLFAAFAEGFDLRMVMRYPVRPLVVFVMNVLLAPLDLVAIFLLPPLAATVTTTARLSGAGAAAGVALALVLSVLVTAVALQILMAAFGRFLRREWTRAVAGLLFGLMFAMPSLFLSGRLGGKKAVAAALDQLAPAAAHLFERLPTTAFPALVARSAIEGRWLLLAAGVAGTLLVVAAGVALGTRWATSAALAGDVTAASRGGAARPIRPGRRPLEALLGAELAVLTGRELRMWLRTPQILVGLLLTPFLVLYYAGDADLGTAVRVFFLPFFCVIAVFNVSANQFGLDREGVRLLLILPVPPARLIAAKNLASATVVAVSTAFCLIIYRLVSHSSLAGLAGAALSVLATTPAVLIGGNALSVRHPWRMTFRVGGMPPGALASAFSQMLVVAGMAALMGIPALLGHLLDKPALPFIGTAALGVIAWTAWSLSLPAAARSLVARREHLLATLAHPDETG